MCSRNDVTVGQNVIDVDDDDVSVEPMQDSPSTNDGAGKRVPRPLSYGRARDPRRGIAPARNSDRNNAITSSAQGVVDLLDSSSDEEEDSPGIDTSVSNGSARAHKRTRTLALKNEGGGTIDDAIDLGDEDDLERNVAVAASQSPQLPNHHPKRDENMPAVRLEKEGIWRMHSKQISGQHTSSEAGSSPVASRVDVGVVVTCDDTARNSNETFGNDDDDDDDDNNNEDTGANNKKLLNADGGERSDSIYEDDKTYSQVDDGDLSPRDAESDSDSDFSCVQVVHPRRRRICMKSCSGLPICRGRGAATGNIPAASSSSAVSFFDLSVSDDEEILPVANTTAKSNASFKDMTSDETAKEGAYHIEKCSGFEKRPEPVGAGAAVDGDDSAKSTEIMQQEEVENADHKLFTSCEAMSWAPCTDESEGDTQDEDARPTPDKSESIDGIAEMAPKSNSARVLLQVPDLPLSDLASTFSRSSSLSISEVSSRGSTDSRVETPRTTRRTLHTRRSACSLDSALNHRRLASAKEKRRRLRHRPGEMYEDPDNVSSLRPTYDDRDYDGLIDSDDFELITTDEKTESGEIAPGIMTIVYTRKYLDETLLPVVEFAVHSAESDEIIYEFRVTVKESLIQGAGNGAFLTFLGARVLPPFRRRGAKYLKDTRPFAPAETTKPLLATHPNGFYMNVKIAGDSLHAPYNCDRLLPPYLVAVVPDPNDGMKEMKIKFSNPEDPYFDNEIEGMQNPSDAVGLLRIHTLEDYVDAPDLTFISNRGRWELIQLALYGPFQASDRKELNHYELKTFIFSNEPGEWGFEIDQKRPDGRVQVADITDDITGMPHSIARENIAMYINETAGDPKLQRTVHAWNHEETGQMHYYLDVCKPMKKGHEIELLVSYDDHYDEIRERKGYGSRSKSGKVQSDDHFPTLLIRNFAEREKTHEIFKELDKPTCLYELSNNMTTYWEQLAGFAYTLLSDLEVPESNQIHVPYVQQIVALRRLEWLSSFFLETRQRLQQELGPTLILMKCDMNTELMKWPWWSTLLNLIEGCNEKLLDARGVDIREKLRNELAEEICYAVRHSLIHPFDENSWCDVANDLVHSLCQEIACHRWRGDSDLFRFIAKKALEASEALQNIELEKVSFGTLAGKRLGVAKERNPGNKFVVARTGRPGATNLLVAIDSSVNRRGIEIDKFWYRSKQILPIARIFRDEFSPNAPVEDLENLCTSMGLGVDVLKTRTPEYLFTKGTWKRATRGVRKDQLKQQSTQKPDVLNVTIGGR